MTAELSYKLFLDKIKKQAISTVNPEAFNRLFNDSQLEVILSKLPATEVVSKRVEDLSQLLITTDTEDYPAIPTIDHGSNSFEMPRTGELIISGVIYPQSLRILNIGFKIAYEGHPCYSDGLGKMFLDAFFLRTDQRYPIMKNPHRHPTLGPVVDRVYYQIYKDNISAIISRENESIDSYAAYMRVEYYRYPREFIFSPDGVSIDCEFRDEVVTEIINLCAIKYVERVTDPRFETKLIEDQRQKNNN
jgi:hypothetical protein